MLFLLKIAIKSFSKISKVSRILEKSLFSLNFLLFVKDALALSKLSIKASDSFANESLALIDNLERAKTSFTNNKKIKENKDSFKILEIFEILEKDLIAIFKRNNIEQIICLNKKFDPNFHQAMLEIDDISKEAGTVVQEIQKGYTMKDRLLRPSLVGVTRFKTQDIRKDQENKENHDAQK